jgi:hypothetical protein
MAHFATYDTEPFLHNDMDFTCHRVVRRGYVIQENM